MKYMIAMGIAFFVAVSASMLQGADDKLPSALKEESKPIKTFDDGSTLTCEKTVSYDPKDPNDTTILWKAVLTRKDSTSKEVVWSDSMHAGKDTLVSLPRELTSCTIYDAAIKDGKLYLVYLRKANITVAATTFADGKVQSTNTMSVSEANSTANSVPRKVVLLPGKQTLQLWIDRHSNLIELWEMDGKEFKLKWSNESELMAETKPTK